MKVKTIVIVALRISSFLITAFPAHATNQIVINGQKDPSIPWVHWFSDNTYEYHGYPKQEQAGNTLAYDAYYYSDNSKLYIFISTDDNTVGSSQRDTFTIYFDVYQLGSLGPEDVAYSIQAPTSLYGPGITMHGPCWSDIQPYSDIAVGSMNGLRTYELAVPLSTLVPDINNVNYRTVKFMIYMENYGDYLYGAHKVVNFYPDAADIGNYQKNSCNWRQIDLSAMCPGFFNPPPPQYSLTVNTVGSGSVVSNPSSSQYVSGTVVQLTANPNVGWQFSGWSGDITGTSNPASITMTSNKAVTATFTQIPYTLTTSIIGTCCQVNVSPNQASYRYGDTVTLTAIPASNWAFSNWMGDLSGNANPATITMNGNKNVMANFVQKTFTLGISYSGSGSGQILSNNTSTNHYGDVIQVTAVPSAGSSFSGWSGDLTGNSNPAYITLNANKAIMGSFTKNQYGVITNIVGGGYVTLSPNQSTFDYGTSVQLTAIPNAGWTFSGWSGDLSGNTNPTSISITANKAITATFTQNQYVVVLGASGQGNPVVSPSQSSYTYGSVVQMFANPVVGWTFSSWSSNTPNIVIANPSQASTSATIDGNGMLTATYTQNTYGLTVNVSPAQGGSMVADKSGPYHFGDVVTLTELASNGYSFSGWSGDAQGAGSTFAVTINGDKAVTASFAQNIDTNNLAILYLTPSNIAGPKPDIGDSFNVTLNVSNVTGLWQWSVSMGWNPSVLN